MEGVEDIPGTALAEGIRWDWETFPEYLDALERMPRAIDIGDAGAARRGARLRDGRARARRATRPPTTSTRCAHRAEALRAGALGFSTGRTAGHRDIHGEPVPGTFAAEDELAALARGDGRGRQRGVFSSCPAGVGGRHRSATRAGAMEAEIDWMVRSASGPAAR